MDNVYIKQPKIIFEKDIYDKNGKAYHFISGKDMSGKFYMLDDFYFNKYTFLDMMALADTSKKLFETQDLMYCLFSDEVDDGLFQIVHSIIFEYLKSHKKHESYYQELFKSEMEEEGIEVVKRKNDPHHIPDAWIKCDQFLIPVEVKLGKFNKKALEQLQRYMNFYKSKFGIAVGKTLTVELPDNIFYISHEALESGSWEVTKISLPDYNCEFYIPENDSEYRRL